MDYSHGKNHLKVQLIYHSMAVNCFSDTKVHIFPRFMI